MSKYIARSGNNGHGVTHLYPAEPRTYKVHGREYTGTAKAVCGVIASGSAACLGTDFSAMPSDVEKPCLKCAAAAQ